MERGALPSVGIPEVVVEHPVNTAHGDYASNLALRLARAAQMSPLEIAGHIAESVGESEEVESASAAPPGFVNLTVRKAWLQAQVETIRAEGEHFADVEYGGGAKVQVEFVSVNPTGPVHIGHGRGAVLGSTLADVLEAAGYTVEREYYVNDAGNQMQNFYRSLYARAAQSLKLDVDVPDDGYQGAYVADAAKEILAEAQDRKALEMLIADKPDEATEQFAVRGRQKMLDLIRTDLDALGVRFDVWFSEQSLFDSGQYDATMERLRESGYLAQREGATWFTSTSLGADKDNVLVRSSGSPTYFASDIAYHYNKFVDRGFDRVIDIWGADHQGHVPRMEAAVSALGIDPERLTVLVSQLVTLRRGDQVVRISKRTGDMITLREVIEEVGADVCRFFLLSRSANSQMDFELELAKDQSEDNPVFYVQYAHARIASILRLAGEQGIDYSEGNVGLLSHEAELMLIRKMLQLPELVELVAMTLEPHHLPHYAQELATAFHAFYKQCRVVDLDKKDLTAARLKLADAARIALARTLQLMGMSAPDRM
jgi:arginyl-tRNA synthetase